MVSDRLIAVALVADYSLNPCSNGIWSLTEATRRLTIMSRLCLNPCSNGIWSLTNGQQWNLCGSGLNPCSNGIWSLTSFPRHAGSFFGVLILVLMEYGL